MRKNVQFSETVIQILHNETCQHVFLMSQADRALQSP